MRRIEIMFVFLICCMSTVFSQEKTAKTDWKIGETGNIYWVVSERSKQLPHHDHMAMSGQSVDMILEWGWDEIR